jgi:hypothetical protein
MGSHFKTNSKEIALLTISLVNPEFMYSFRKIAIIQPLPCLAMNTVSPQAYPKPLSNLHRNSLAAGFVELINLVYTPANESVMPVPS